MHVVLSGGQFFLQFLHFFFTILTIFVNFDNFDISGWFLTTLQLRQFLNFVWQFWHFLQLWIILTMTMIIQETCGLCDIDYNSDNWETEFMTISVTWQLRVTLDSIYSCNFCEVYPAYKSSKLCKFCHSPNLGMLLVTSNWYIISEYNEYGLKGGQNLEFIWLKNVLQRW